MDPTEYQRLVLTHAVHAIACDGEIHPQEVDEIRRMVRETPYFDVLDAEREVAAALEGLREGSRTVERQLAVLAEQGLSEPQRIRLLEVLLHAVHADGAVSSPEKAYLQRVRSALGIGTGELVRHFPTRLTLLSPTPGASFEEVVEFTLPDTIPDTTSFFVDEGANPSGDT